MEDMIRLLAAELGQKPQHVGAVVRLLDEGNTIPFIARYRKEQHGAMDDTTLRTLAERLQYLRNLAQRREEIRRSIAAQEKLTDELDAALQAAVTLSELEDLYRPYKPKRRTRATIARERGLAPLAEQLLGQARDLPDPLTLAAGFADPARGVETPEDALAGASDIVAETVSDDAAVRKALRSLMQRQSVLRTQAAKGKEEETSVYQLYYDFRQPVSRLQGHQILAVNRGEREGFLKVTLETDREQALICVRRCVLVPGGGAAAFLRAACEDAYDRLIAPSMERELRTALTERANEGAIRNFALNLRPLLMQPPVRGHVTMGLDPGYSHGCKVAVVDPTGKVLDTAVVYPTFSKAKRAEAIETLRRLMDRYEVTHIALGNGTASRETEAMVCELLRQKHGAAYMIVSEAGASVYSASPLAAEEFPQYDVNLRSAVSIARRLQDPLAELVKIDPKAIGVGQYQHDVDQQKLAHRLDAVVEDCVNAVGVDVNTASSALLCRVAGLSPARANAIVSFRSANGAFRTRRDLLAVPRLGAKTFEQAAGFLRIPDGDDPLDASAVHPEAYPVVLRILKKTGLDIKALIGNAAVLRSLHARDFVDEHFGIPTVTDILGELLKPGRDPRPEFRTAKFADGIKEMKDLQPGMVLEGVVTNVAAFGAFVDVGVHQDGLVHISHLADRRVSDPRDVVKVGDIVKVRVLEVDLARQRISLSMRSEGARRQAPAARRDTRSAAPSQGAMAAAFAKLRR